ncbi:MAG TPA: hypothetical protein VGX03_21965 [Candidatus Binatia bacterium]|jgi:hypothetical protein|nr:hypothetical protein [Candidatus Binatia bacterium]
MGLLVAQILLTVAAWWKGWRAWALLPVGLSLLAGFLLGVVAEDPVSVAGTAVLADVICTGALIPMANWAPQPAALPAKSEVSA